MQVKPKFLPFLWPFYWASMTVAFLLMGEIMPHEEAWLILQQAVGRDHGLLLSTHLPLGLLGPQGASAPGPQGAPSLGRPSQTHSLSAPLGQK